MNQPRHREPIFNVPGVVTGLLGLFIAIHVIRNFLPEASDQWWTLALAFIPVRFTGYAAQLPGGTITSFTSFLTHAFVHGDAMHLAINSAWMLAFGSALARRLGTLRFLLFSAFCAIAGAAAFLLGRYSGGQSIIPMVGASGAIAGLMGGTMRFLFNAIGGPRPRDLHDNIRAVPRMSVVEAFQNRSILFATGGWLIINLLFAYGASAITSAGGIAWEAHLGGYFAGLLAFGLFDPGRARPYDRSDYIWDAEEDEATRPENASDETPETNRHPGAGNDPGPTMH